MAKTYRIPFENMKELKAKMESLGRRASKHGMDGFVRIEWSGPTIVADGDMGQEYYHVTIECSPVVIAGWELVARVDHGDNANILAVVPGADEMPVEFRTTKATRCDHCHTARERNNTFVVRNVDTGEYRQVGRNCLADFLGTDPEFMVQMASFAKTAEESCDSATGYHGPRIPHHYRAESLLEAAARVVAKEGYVSAKMGDASTIQAVRCLMDRGNGFRYSHANKNYPECERATELVAMAREAADKMRGENDWERNVKTLMGQEWVAFNHASMLVSVFAAVAKADHKAKPDASRSNHLAFPGQKIEVVGLVVFARSFTTQYGQTRIVKVQTAAGDMVQWFATTNPNVHEGDNVKIEGTVKAHDTDKYTGGKVTTVTRCKLNRV